MIPEIRKVIEEFSDFCGDLAISTDYPDEKCVEEWFVRYFIAKTNAIKDLNKHAKPAP